MTTDDIERDGTKKQLTDFPTSCSLIIALSNIIVCSSFLIECKDLMSTKITLNSDIVKHNVYNEMVHLFYKIHIINY